MGAECRVPYATIYNSAFQMIFSLQIHWQNMKDVFHPYLLEYMYIHIASHTFVYLWMFFVGPLFHSGFDINKKKRTKKFSLYAL